MTLDQIATAVGAKVDDSTRRGAAQREGAHRVTVRGISTDSRDTQPGDLFVAIRGQRLDGHQFVNQAIESGAAACLVASDWSKEACRAGIARHRCLRVDDTVSALGRLAAYYRRDVLPATVRVIGITGSNGKTTTKQMIDHLLGADMQGIASPKNYNNHIGVPLTLLSAGADDTYIVAEIGTNAPGEVALLGEMVSPDVAVITSIGEAHLEGLHSVEAVAAEKASLVDHVRPGGLAIVNVDRAELRRCLRAPAQVRMVTFGFDARADQHVVPLCVDLSGTVFVLGLDYRLELRDLPGVHHASNAAAAWLVGRSFGVSAEAMAERLATFRPSAGRARVIELGGVTLVDDAYNANPASLLAAVETLRCDPSHRRVLVMGDMLELGEKTNSLHERVVGAAVASEIEVLLAVGERSARAAHVLVQEGCATTVASCVDAADAIRTLVPLLRRGDCVWVKGSRAVGLDRLVEDLEAAFAEPVSA